jgi:hypothetical protein
MAGLAFEQAVHRLVAHSALQVEDLIGRAGHLVGHDLLLETGLLGLGRFLYGLFAFRT